MNDRIRQIRKDMNLNQTEFGNEIGASRAMVTSYELGKVVPDKSMRLLICQKFNVSETWLETGKGEPYNTGLVPELTQALRQMPAVQAALERLLPRLTAEDFAKINELVDKITANKNPNEL